MLTRSRLLNLLIQVLVLNLLLLLLLLLILLSINIVLRSVSLLLLLRLGGRPRSGLRWRGRRRLSGVTHRRNHEFLDIAVNGDLNGWL